MLPIALFAGAHLPSSCTAAALGVTQRSGNMVVEGCGTIVPLLRVLVRRNRNTEGRPPLGLGASPRPGQPLRLARTRQPTLALGDILPLLASTEPSSKSLPHPGSVLQPLMVARARRSCPDSPLTCVWPPHSLGWFRRYTLGLSRLSSIVGVPALTVPRIAAGRPTSACDGVPPPPSGCKPLLLPPITDQHRAGLEAPTVRVSMQCFECSGDPKLAVPWATAMSACRGLARAECGLGVAGLPRLGCGLG